MRIGGSVDRCLGIEQVDVARDMRDNGHAFVFQGASRLLGDDGSVRPHCPRDEPAVVCKYATVDIDEVLGMERRCHQVDGFQGQAAHNECGGGVEAGQRHALSGAHGMFRLVPECVHGLDGFGLPVWNRVGGVLVQSEMPTDVDVVVICIALVSEECV